MDILKTLFSFLRSLFKSKQSEETETIDVDFSDEDKTEILDALRPIIKQLNDDDTYKKICEGLNTVKLLKTYSNMSEDKKKLTINLTQSPSFNGEVEVVGFVKDTVMEEFKKKLAEDMKKKYSMEADQGSIVIKKSL